MNNTIALKSTQSLSLPLILKDTDYKLTQFSQKNINLL